MNNLAWILATHPDAARRNPGKAVQLAEAATRLTQRKEPNFLDTLGVAYAAAGQFEDACRAADLAVALYQVAGDARMEQEVRARLELYKKGAAYRP
jgi:Flp pilus assembly protein TadD